MLRILYWFKFHWNLSWWRHQMETVSALLAFCARNSHVAGEFPAQRPVTRNFDAFFDLRLIQQLSKQWRRWWFETQQRSLWRLCNDCPACRTLWDRTRILICDMWILICLVRLNVPHSCELSFDFLWFFLFIFLFSFYFVWMYFFYYFGYLVVIKYEFYPFFSFICKYRFLLICACLHMSPIVLIN